MYLVQIPYNHNEITPERHERDKKNRNCKLLFQKNPIYVSDIKHEIVT